MSVICVHQLDTWIMAMNANISNHRDLSMQHIQFPNLLGPVPRLVQQINVRYIPPPANLIELIKSLMISSLGESGVLV